MDGGDRNRHTHTGVDVTLCTHRWGQQALYTSNHALSRNQEDVLGGGGRGRGSGGGRGKEAEGVCRELYR